MRKLTLRLTKLGVFMLILFSGIPAMGQVPVLTQHNDNARTGQNLQETLLNTSTVNQSNFGKVFWRTVDGFIYAQPLYVPGLTIQGATHNVIYVATQHNSVYAFDADNPNEPAPLWQVNLGTPVPSQDICILTGDTNPADCPYYDISPEIGITSTPVIDTTAGIIYVVSRTKNTSDSTYHDYLHALDLITGAERLGGPTEIVGQVSGTGNGSVGGVLTFEPAYHHQRPSLLLLNGVLYIGFGSVGDIGTYHGWFMTYNASTLQQETIISITPNGSEGGVWSSGQGPVADASGNVYIMTANGDFNANSGGKDYGDSFLKFSGSSLTIADYFTPFNQASLDSGNVDLGSGGPMLMPGTSLLVGMGKDGIFRVVNTNTGSMGEYNTSVDNDVQEFSVSPSYEFFSSPVYWDSPNNGPVVYVWAPADYLKAFQFNGTKFATTPVSESTIQNSAGESNAAAVSVSANGSQSGTGIVWTSSSLSQWASGIQVPGVVRAFDATNLTSELWDSTQDLTRDDVGGYAKYVPPTISNGKVYVSSFSGQLQVYGLNPPAFQGIRFIQVASATPQSTTSSVSVAYPSSQTATDLNVVIVGWNDASATVQSVTDAAGNAYSLAIGPTSGTNLRQSIYYAKNIAGGSNTVTVTFNQGATKPDVRILEYSGVATSNPLDVSAGASGNSNISDSGFVTTTAANELVVGAGMVSSNTTVMAGAPFTPRVITSPDSDIAADRLVNVPGSYHSWAPLNASGVWVDQVVTFKSAAVSQIPFISSISPSSGTTAGGTAVTITGIDFATGATVTFGSSSATNVVVVNATTITATTPVGTAGAVTVTVTNAGGQSGSLMNGYTYLAPPTVSGVSPNTGSTSGGTSVTITGTNFASGATVTFGSGSATNVVVVNSTTITATTPAESVGAVSVTVTVNGQSGSLANGFTYAVVPTVSSVSPNNGPVAGGTSVTITGTNFASGATVMFGSAAATNVTVVNSTTITATTPAGSIGAVSVTVTVNGQSGSLTNGYTYVAPPTVTSVSPNTGSTSGGTSVTITGTNFATGATVTFGSAAATNVVVVNSTTMTATTPAGSAGAVTVTVTNVGSQSGSLTNGFTYAVVPTVSSVSPNSGPVAGGTSVTISGTNFATGATVKFGSTAATGVTVVNSTTITATTPASGSAGAVTVTVTVGSQSGSLANGFTYTGSIAIAFGQVAAATPQTPTASVPVTYPAAQTAGDLNIVVVGWNDTTSTVQSVKDSAGNNYVLAVGPTAGTGLQQSIYYASNIVGGSNTVTVTFSAAAAYPDVRILEYRGVTTLDVTAGASGNSASASSGAATTTVANELIIGANTVSTGNSAAGTGFTSRIITTPDGDIAEDKIVTTAGSNSATATLTGSGPWVMQMATFAAVTGPVPTVSSVSPNTGTTAGGTAVTITGTNFATGATLTFGSGSATNVVVVNSTTITAATPAGSAGAATVTVTVGGQSGSLASGFTYVAPPTVSSVSPNSGPVAGGTTVTITGTGFAAGATVMFEFQSRQETSATNVTVVNSTTITATTPVTNPPGTAGAATVIVTNTGGLSGSLAGGFTYVGSPTIASVSPSSGSTSGGTAVTITGTNFAAGATVTFGSTAGTNVTVVSSTSITATTPAGSAGAVNVTVTNIGSQSGSLTNGYMYVVAPTVSSVSPSTGSTAGGTAVTITGTNFATGATVTFGSAAATNVTVVSSTTITATTPAGSAGAVTVTVTNTGGQSGNLTNGFTYVAPPTVSSVSPNTGSTAGGTAVTITGTNFVSGTAVKFGSGSATNVVVVNATTITATTPAGSAGAVTVTVTVSGQSGSLTNGYTYVVTPTVSSVSPNSGPVAGGTSVTITGTNFASGATVMFGSAAATNVVVVNATTITATTPAGSAGVVTVTVTVGGQSGSLTNGFTYIGVPTVSSVSPNTGTTAGGTSVTITGTNFAAGATVTFGSGSATNVVVVNATTITATTPAGSAGAVTVTVTNVGSQSGSLTNGFTYAVVPTVSSVSPNSGPVAGGTAVTISGTNFATGATVKFGSTAATGVTVVNSTTITATTPASGSAGAVTVTVTVGSQSGSLANGFTYTGSIAIAFGQVAAATPQTPTASVPVTYPAAQTAGDLNIVVVGWNDTTSTVQSVKDSAGNNYVLAVGPTAGTGLQQSIYYASNIVGGSNTVTVTFSAAAAYPDVRILEYRGVTTLDVTAGASGNSASASSGAATTTGANELIFGANTVSTLNGAAGTGFTSRIITTPNGDIAEDKIVTAAGSNSATATLTASGPWVMQMATFAAVTGPVPTVSSVSPNTGSTAGGTSVTITGTNFAAGATVTFGSGSATNVVVVNATTITATTPVGSAGAASVTVTVGGQSGSLASGFTYVAPPTVSSVSPNGGTTAGGTSVTITGTNFASGATVTFGTAAATNVVVVNATTLTATTPAGSSGAATVTVTVSGQSGSLTNGYTYTVPPTVTSVSPSSGSTSGGTTVTITGTNFAAGATVTFGSTAGTNVTVVSSTSITATTPAGSAGAVNVTVTNIGSQSGSLTNGYMYVVAPTVSSVSPSTGSTAGGTAVTITGTNFATGATVTFGSAAATNVTVVSSTTITATTPAGSAGAVTVTVTNTGGQSGNLTNGFTYVAPPTVSSVSPNTGSTAGGTAVTITGTNFVSGTAVKFGSGSATNVVVVNATTITATTPAGSAGAVTVTVTVSGQSGSLTNGYTYVVTPTVSSVSPNSGPVAGGTSVTITGTNFASGATVMFGSAAATNVVVVNATTITATTPAGSAGVVTVTVTVGGQSGSLTNGFTYIGVPTVSSVSPNTGTTAGGTSVTITGTNFAAGATVTFGSGSATNVVVVNATTITATTPAGSAGAVTVTVTNVGSQSGSLTNGFTYAVVPTVSSVSPNSGPVAGGTAVTISGTNFATGATVKFGSTAATGVTVVNSTTITATTPASGSAGAVTVTVTVGSQSGSLANGFTYTGSIAIAFGQVAAATPQTPTASVPVTYPAAQTAGDLNIVVVGWNDTTSTVQSVKDSAGNNYVLAVGPTAGTGLQQSIYYASNIVGGSNTVTVTFSAAAAYPDVRILEYRGVTTLDVTAGASGNSASASSGAATTTGANELIFGANTVSTLNGAAGTGFTSRIITTPNGDIAEDKIVTAAGSNSATATLTASGPWVMQMATFSSGPTPTVGSVNPNTGTTAGGTAVTITGTNFASGATVTFGSGSATNVVVVNSTTITATTPAGSAGVATVTVTDPGGEASSLASGYTYITPPTVTSVNPSNGGLAGGMSVTITGTNFASGATVTFGSGSATNVVVVNATTITATTPAESAGTVAVTVTNTSGLGGSLATGFTYIAPPTVTNVNPNTGPTAGGASVTITGTNFLSGATVTFGGTAATSVVVVNSTTITATTPVGNAGAVTVTVTVGAQSGSLTNGYTYSSQVVVVTPPGSFAGVLAGTAAPTYVAGQQYYNATAGTSFTTAAFNSTGADLLLMFLGCHNATVFTITDTYGNTWIPLAGPAYKVGNPSYPMEGEFFYVPNAKTGAGHTITVTLSQTEPLVASIVAVAGDNIYSPIDTYSPITGDNGTLSKYISSAPLTTSQPNDLILGIVKGYGNNTYTAGTGYTSQLASTGNNFSAETQAAASVGSYNSYFTATTSDFWQSVTAAISPMLTQTTLSWTASTGGIIANYNVERCVGLGCTSFSQIASIPSTSLSYSDTAIAAGTIYNYRVRAQNSVGTFSAYSNTLTFSPIIPQVVSNFTATQTGKLAWNVASESGGLISQYSIERCTGTGCTNFSQIATTSATSYTDTSVAAGTTYNYRVRAQDTNGFYGPYSVAASASLPAYFDNAADGGNNGGTSTSLTYSYTVGTNANRLLLVSVVGDPSVDDISSVTYAGASMTLVAKIQTPSDRWHYLYYLLSPASGANNVVITAASSHTLMSEASSWFNIAQSGQPGAFSTNTSPSDVSTMMTSLPASSNNAIVVESMWAPLQILPGNGSSELALDASMLSLGMFSSVPNPVSQAYPVSITNTWGGQFAASSIMSSFTLASNGTAGIAYDNTKDGGNNGGTTASLTYSYKEGTGSNRLLVVNLIGDTSADDISSVTYAGTPLTLVKKLQSPSNNWQYVYYLLNPTSGTNNVVITAGSTHYLISQAASWSNVKQSAQPDAVTTNTAPATNTSITTSLTTVAPGSLVVQGVWSYGHLTAGSGAALIITDAALDGAGIFVSGQSPVTPAGNVSMTTISDGTTSSGAIMVSFAPAP